MKGTALNNESTLEREADAVGRLAARSSASRRPTTANLHAMPGLAESGRSASPRLHHSGEAIPQWSQFYSGAQPAQPQAGGVCQLLPAASPWWPATENDREIIINGYGFDFEKGGEVDGPGFHDGTYSILENQPKSFKMQMTVGNNKAHNNDLNVILAIKEGQATITGSVKGETLKKAFTSPVSGAGSKISPFSLSFTGEDGAKTTISWRVDD